MTHDFFVPGWVSDPPRVRETIQRRAEAGQLVTGSLFTSKSAQALPGTWRRKIAEGVRGIFLRDAERRLLGTPRRPFFQKRGTCVARGMLRGLQTSLDFSIINTISLEQPVELSFAPIYSMARNEIGRGRCGFGDGAILGDAAEAVHDLGVSTTDIFQGMTEDEIEQQAVYYAQPGLQTPKKWLDAAAGHTSITFWVETLDLLFDCIAAGYAVPYAHGYVTDGRPNKNGLAGLGTYGPHCRCFTGVFLDEHGETQLVSSESWGRFPAGDPSYDDQTMPIEQMPCVLLRYADNVKQLNPGDVGIYARQFWDQINDGGEAWAVSAPRFTSKSLAEATRPAVAV